MKQHIETVQAYLDCLFSGPGGYDRARQYLADNVIAEDTLMGETRGADALIAQLKSYGDNDPAQKDVRHVTADAESVAALSFWALPGGEAVAFAQWFWFSGQRIARMKAIYDPRPFLALAASGGQ